jgi:hypothetical protein
LILRTDDIGAFFTEPTSGVALSEAVERSKDQRTSERDGHFAAHQRGN